MQRERGPGDIERWQAPESGSRWRGRRDSQIGPSALGAKLAVSESGEMAGSVSGGWSRTRFSATRARCWRARTAASPLRDLGRSRATVGFRRGEIDVFVDAPNEQLLDR